MISKKRAVLMTLVAMLLTFSLTLAGSLYVGFKHDDRIIITMSRYDELRQLENKYSKHEYIIDYVSSQFLYDVDKEDLMEGSFSGILDVLQDPYSEYLTVDDFNSLIEQTQGEYSGIGVYVSVTEDNKIIVVAPIEDTPADKAGIRTGDYIVKVNGQEYTGDRLSDAVNVMKGKPGTDVTVTINRPLKDGGVDIFDVVITRQNIKIATVKHEMMTEDIGYVRITTFDQQTDEDFEKAIDEMKRMGMERLIVDLRFNPGGLVSSVAEIADMLLGETIITYTETKGGEREYYHSGKSSLEMPLVVLINEGSASASEILAGAVKDTDAGVLVGTQTFGKGIVQRIMPLEDGSGVKLTVSEYFTPNNINIHGIGIEPNVYVELPDEALYGPENLEEDTQLQKALEILAE